MSPLANLLSRGKEEADPSTDVSDLPAPALTVVAKVNLLPPEIGEAERFRREQVLRGAVVVVAVGAVAFLTVGASAQVTKANNRVTVANARATELQAQVAALSDVPTTAAQLKTAQAQRYGALGAEVRWSQYLNGLSLATDKLNTQLLTMNVTQNVDPATSGTPGATSYMGLPGIATVTYTGLAKDHKTVSYFLDALAKQPGNVDPSFTSSLEQPDPNDPLKTDAAFSATVTVTDSAESHRYPPTGD